MAVAWQDWSSKAFARAKKEKKPVLLSISAVWCHWCHEMDKEAYADARVIEVINKFFVPVRVDTDVRPDINARYNLGGWPTTAVLSPEGRLLTGGLFMPASQMLVFLDGARSLKWLPLEKASTIVVPKKVEISRVVVEDVLKGCEEGFDPVYGGFGVAPKFPHPEALLFLLELYERDRSDSVKGMLVRTLDGMMKGEIHDKEEGGFFRYATQQDWSIPHFEKMLEDNAGLLEVYARASVLLRSREYQEVAEGIAEFLLKVLFDKKEHLFCGSQDADEAYCHLSREERKGAKKPFIDRRFFVGWNARAITALLRAGKWLDNPLLRSIGLRSLNILISKTVTSKGVLHVVGIEGPLLAKNAALLLEAVLEAERFEDSAKRIVDNLQKDFVQKGILVDVCKQKKAVGYLNELRLDGESVGLFARCLVLMGEKKHAGVFVNREWNLGLFGASLGRAAVLSEESEGVCA